MADYKKKKGIKVSVSRETSNSRQIEAQRRAAAKAAEREAELARKAQINEEKMTERELQRRRAAEQERQAEYNRRLERELLEEAASIPSREKKPSTNKKEVRYSKPPVKRYSARRPVATADYENDATFSVVDGKKLLRRKQRRVVVLLALILAAILIIAAVVTPVGMVEYLQNGFAKLGGGNGYPILISNDSSRFVSVQNGVTVVVGDTSAECYNGSGKQVFLRYHGYLNPSLAQSSSRLVMYDRGGTGYSVENMNKVLYSGNLDKKILTAGVGRNGTVAFATSSVEYNSELAVFDKDMKNIYNWYSSDLTITSVVVSDSGREVAVAAVGVSGGQFMSTIYIFDVKSSVPKATASVAGSAVVSAERINSNLFLISCNDQAVVMDWSGNQRYIYKADGQLYLSKVCDGKAVLVDKLLSNSGEYAVRIVDSKYKLSSDFTVDINLKDITISGNYVYLLTDNKIIPYSPDGSPLEGIDCDFRVSAIESAGGGRVIISGLGELEEIKRP